MPQFTLTSYFLVAFSILVHAPFGKRLGIKHFFTSVIVGLSLSGLAIGLMANFCSGLIRPIAISIILLGMFLTIADLRKHRFRFFLSIDQKKVYLFLLTLGLFLFLINNPAKVFLEQSGSQTLLRFNSHYSYYSSQSTEMLEAKYFSRLKVANLMPYEWSQYHFFNSGTRAISMGLVKQPGLFSYWITQTLIVIFILLSLAENFLFSFGLKIRNILALAVWFVLGFTLFDHSLSWNLTTTGPFSIFATVLLILAIYKKNWRHSLIFAFILGASVIRLLPISLIVVVFISWHLIKINSADNQKINLRHITALLHQKTRLKLIDFFALLLFALYNLATIVSAKAAPVQEKLPLITEKVFDHGWFYAMTSYKIACFIFEHTRHLKPYYVFDDLVFYSKESANLVIDKSLVLLMAIAILTTIYYSVKIIIENRGVLNFYLILALLVAIHYYFMPYGILLLHSLLLPYFVITILLVYYITKKQKSNDWFLLQLLILTYLCALIYQYLGIPFSIKVPACYIVYDTALWGIIGLYLFVFANRPKILGVAMTIALAALVLFHFSLSGVVRIPQSNDFLSTKIDITPLVSDNFKRSDYVDGHNLATFQFDNPSYDDAYSAVLGSNLNYSPLYSSFLNMNWITK